LPDPLTTNQKAPWVRILPGHCNVDEKFIAMIEKYHG
jgi:hypothetical protein